MNISEFSVKNPVFANLVMVLIIVAGIFSMTRLPQEEIPPIDFNWAFVVVLYPGASPEDIENLVVTPIEDKVRNLDNVDRYTSNISEGMAMVMIEYADMSDDDFLFEFQEVKNSISDITFPEGVLDYTVDKLSTSMFLPLINVALSYFGDEEIALKTAEDLKEDIERIPGVGNVDISGLSDKEVEILVNPQALMNLKIPLSSVVSTVQSANISLPLGDIDLASTNYLLKAESLLSIEEMEKLPIITGQTGATITLGDIATVNRQRQEKTSISRLDGKNSITITISKKAEGQTIFISDRVRDLVEKYENLSPASVGFHVLSDQAEQVKKNVSVLRNNAIIGMFVVLITMYLFLGFYNAILSLVGIPISFLITFFLMGVFDQTINGSSLFALVMILGIVIDDAIIILENVFANKNKNNTIEQATIKGVNEVLAPVVSGILTTVAVFLPLMFLPGILGKFLRVVPLVASLALFASLFEALFILPSHIVEWTPKKRRKLSQGVITLKKLLPFYQKNLKRVLRFRYLGIVLFFIALPVISIVTVKSVGVDFFSGDPYPRFTLLVKFQESTPLSATDSLITHIGGIVADVIPDNKRKTVATEAGVLQGQGEWINQKNVAQVKIEIEDRFTEEIDDFADGIRQQVRKMAEIEYFEVSKIQGGPPQNDPISVRISGESLSQIKEASVAIQNFLKEHEGVFDIGDDMPVDRNQITFKINPHKAKLYNLSTNEILTELRAALFGVKVSEFVEYTDRIDINLRYEKEQFSNFDNIRSLSVVSRDFRAVPITNVADVKMQKGISSIRRFDGERTAIVSANINRDRVQLNEINATIENEIFPIIKEQFSSLNFEIGGAFADFTETLQDLIRLFVIAVLLIYIILATQFRSYIQPVIILFTVLFGAIGAMFGLFVMRYPLSIGSLYGIVALSGIAVNDAIVLISFVNNSRKDGMERVESVINGASRRLRPIILTSLTTIFALLPTVIGIGGKSLTWQPFASTIAFGLLVSTLMTLFLIPALILIVDDLKGIFVRNKR